MSDTKFRHCFGETVDTYEVTGNLVSEILKKASKKIAKFEDEGTYSWYTTDLRYVGDAGLGYDFELLIHAHHA